MPQRRESWELRAGLAQLLGGRAESGGRSFAHFGDHLIVDVGHHALQVALATVVRAPLVVDTCGTHGRVTFRSGAHRIDTFVMRDCVVAVAKERNA